MRSIYVQPPKGTYEIIVVDNASVDGSANMIESEFPDVVLICNAKNFGYARANNQGAEIAKGKYILLLGSDTEVRGNALEKMIQFMNEYHNAGAVGCKLVTPDGKLQPSCKRFPTPLNAAALYCSLNWLNSGYLMKKFKHDVVRSVDQPDATCLIVRKAIVDSFGLFDERLTILYNDVELCRRIKHSGWEIYFTPLAVVMHHGSRSTKQANPKLRLEMYCNILLYYRMHFGRKAEYFLLPILLFRLMAVTKSPIALKLFSFHHDTKAELSLLHSQLR